MKSDKALLPSRVTWQETSLIVGWLHSYWTQILAERTSHFCLQDTERKCRIFHQNYINLQAENKKFFSHSNYTIKKKDPSFHNTSEISISRLSISIKKKLNLSFHNTSEISITPFSFKTNPVNMLCPPPKKKSIWLLWYFYLSWLIKYHTCTISVISFLFHQTKTLG